VGCRVFILRDDALSEIRQPGFSPRENQSKCAVDELPTLLSSRCLRPFGPQGRLVGNSTAACFLLAHGLQRESQDAISNSLLERREEKVRNILICFLILPS